MATKKTTKAADTTDGKAKKTSKKAADKASPKADSTRNLAPRTKGKVQEYQPDQTYSVGDLVYHPVWGHEGKVVEVGKTADGLEKMLVDFGRSGTKKLVMGYSFHF